MTQTPAEPPPISGEVICMETRDDRGKVVADALASPDERLATSAGVLVLILDASCQGGPQ